MPFPDRDSRSAVSRPALAGAGALLACAAAVRYLASRDEEARPQRGKFLHVRGHKLHVVDEGEGPCVILLHGNGSMIEDLHSSGLIDLLKQDHRVVAFDRPGFGLSERPDWGWTPEAEAAFLSQALALLDVDEAIIVAHSWAALVAICMALRPGIVANGLVLLSGYYFPTARLDTALQAPATWPVVGGALRYTVLPIMARLMAGVEFRKMFAPLPVSPEFLAEYPVGLASRPSQLKSLADDTVEMPKAAARLSGRYRDLTLPVHIIAGAGDKIVSTAHQSAQLHGMLPTSTLQTLEGFGHMVHHAHPELVVEAVRAMTKGGSPLISPEENRVDGVVAAPAKPF